MPWVLEPNLAEPNQISDQNQVIQKRKESFRLFIPKSFKIEQEIKTQIPLFFFCQNNGICVPILIWKIIVNLRNLKN